MVPETSYQTASQPYRGCKFGTLDFPAPERFAVKVSYLHIGVRSPYLGHMHPEDVRNFSAITSVSETFTPKTTVPTARRTVPIGRHGDAIHTDSRNFRHR